MPDNDVMRAEVATGLSRPQKELLPKYFYDERGSRLFAEITRQPEYYPTRAERTLLRRFAPAWVPDVGLQALLELGAGNADKTRIILDAMVAHAEDPVYVPIDISGDFLHDMARRLRQEYPRLRVRPVVADITAEIHPPDHLPEPGAYALLGSTIGNFKAHKAMELLRHVADALRPSDLFLAGFDLKKDREVLEAAYNDAAGITAAFNLNILDVLNRELGADFDVDGFRHHAFYNEEEARIEMHLVSRRDQTVRIPGVGAIEIRRDESIRTELSHKYDRAAVEELFEEAGLRLDRWEVSDHGLFALATAS